MVEERYTVEKAWPHGDNYCVVVMNHLTGCRCGYVGIGPSHPLYGLDHDDNLFGPDSPRVDILFNVHGGINFSSGDPECLSFLLDNLGRHWWFGFDCAHKGDGSDIEQIFSESSRRYHKNSPGDVIRTLDYCIDECESLSQQLEALK